MPMEIKRFNPKYDEGLTSEQVNQRIAENLTNINENLKLKQSSKSFIVMFSLISTF